MERMSKKEIRKFTNIVNNVILEKNFLGYQLESEIFGNRADKPYQCVFYKRICGGVEFRLVIRIEEFPGFDMRNIHVECQAARVADMFTFVSYSTLPSPRGGELKFPVPLLIILYYCYRPRVGVS